MANYGRAKCLDEQAHSDGVKKLLNKIAAKHGKSRGDIVIAYLEDISVFAVRQWLVRPIPHRHWQALADLAEMNVDQIEKIATKNFQMKYYE